MAYKRGHFTCITAIYTLEKACFTNPQADLLDMIKLKLHIKKHSIGFENT